MRTALSNFLSIVITSAPPPRLLLLANWFETESQKKIRQELQELKQSHADTHLQLRTSRLTIRRLKSSLTAMIYHMLLSSTYTGSGGSAQNGGGSAPPQQLKASRTVGLFDDEKEAETRRAAFRATGAELRDRLGCHGWVVCAPRKVAAGNISAYEEENIEKNREEEAATTDAILRLVDNWLTLSEP